MSTSYGLDNNRTRWSYNCWVPYDKGQDNYQLDAALNRINLEKSISGISYMGLSGREMVPGFGYNLKSLYTIRVAWEASWQEKFTLEDPANEKKTWGWGLAVRVRDWEQGTLKKVVLGASLVSCLTSSFFTERTMLFKGADIIPAGGVTREYLHSLPSTNAAAFMEGFRLRPSMEDPERPTQKDGPSPVMKGCTGPNGPNCSLQLL